MGGWRVVRTGDSRIAFAINHIENPEMGLQRPIQATLVLWSVGFLWLYSWTPSLAQILTRGRASLRSDAVEASSVFAGFATKATIFLAIFAAVLAVLAAVGDRSHELRARLWIPAALVLPWFTIYIVETLIINETTPKYYELIWPLMLVAFSLTAPPVHTVCVLLARIGVATAGLSIILGIWGKGLMPYGWHQTDDKAIIGDTALAGPYSHSNILGLLMALALPLVVLVLRDRERQIGLLLVGVTLVWSASRISIVAAVVIVAVIVAAKYVRRPWRLVAAATVLAALTMVVVPLRTHDDAAFTNRGLIWKVTRFYAADHPWFGWGTGVFQSLNNEFTSAIGTRAVTAHNTWLTVLAVGGWVAVAATIVTYATAARRFTRTYCDLRAPAFFLLALVVCGIAEDPLRAWRLTPLSFLVWTGLALAVCAHSDTIRQNPTTASTGPAV